MQETNSFLQISFALPKITEYLTQSDKIHLSAVNKYLHQRIYTTNQFWSTLEIYNQYAESQQQWESFYQWLSKYLKIINPLFISISIYDISEKAQKDILNLLMNGIIQSVQKLDIYIQSDDVHLATSLCFPNIHQLIIRSKCASDQLVGFMFQNMKNIDQLTVIKNDMSFSCANLATYCKNQLTKLELKPYLLNFDEVQKICEVSAHTLNQLQIDVQQCPNETIVDIISPLKNLQKLRLYHLQNLISDKQLLQVLSNKNHISQLSLSKAQNFPLNRIINQIKSANLLQVDFTSCKQLNDDDMIELCQSSQNLRSINISWCNLVTNKGLKFIIKNALKLEKLDISGNKQANDTIFQEYVDLVQYFNINVFHKMKHQYKISHASGQLKEKYQEITADDKFFDGKIDIKQERKKIKSLRFMKILNCQSCNKISDDILYVIYWVNRKIKGINYYGNVMSLTVDPDQKDFD